MMSNLKITENFPLIYSMNRNGKLYMYTNVYTEEPLYYGLMRNLSIMTHGEPLYYGLMRNLSINDSWGTSLVWTHGDLSIMDSWGTSLLWMDS